MLMILFISITSCIDGSKNSSIQKTQTFTCPMHPEVIKHEMGTCPICKMDLVQVDKNKAKNNELMLSEDQIKLANIKTLKISDGEFSNTKELKGVLQISPLSTKIISSKFGGRIEQLYFKETGTSIKKGQVLFSIYSEELLTLQRDYLLNIKQKESFPNENIYEKLTETARKKLSLYGYSNAQIQHLVSTKKLNARITVTADESGIIKDINASEGQYVSEGSPVFVLEDLNTLWLETEVYPEEARNIKLGQSLKVIIGGYENESISAKIEFIGPQLQENSQLVVIRASIPNSEQKYQAGMYASISLANTNKSNIIKLPINAVVREELHNQVWIRTGNNTFEPRYVELGEESESQIIITKGLNKNDEVVISGAYLLYSEHKLKK